MVFKLFFLEFRRFNLNFYECLIINLNSEIKKVILREKNATFLRCKDNIFYSYDFLSHNFNVKKYKL